jgi:acyl-coenzyme A thioesterase PaaI-like protein
MPESWRTRLERWGFNLFPAFRRTGARLSYIADDHREVRIVLPFSWRTRNYVGTMFGGSVYAAGDGVYMIMLIKNLGRDYVVWDKSATVRFGKPARTTLYARFTLSAEELEGIRKALASGEAIERAHRVEFTDGAGTVHAEVEWLIHIRRREAAPR